MRFRIEDQGAPDQAALATIGGIILAAAERQRAEADSANIDRPHPENAKTRRPRQAARFGEVDASAGAPPST